MNEPPPDVRVDWRVVTAIAGGLVLLFTAQNYVAPAAALQESATCDDDAVAVSVIATPLALCEMLKLLPAIVSVVDRSFPVLFVVNEY